MPRVHVWFEEGDWIDKLQGAAYLRAKSVLPASATTSQLLRETSRCRSSVMSASLAKGHAQLWIDALHNVLALPAAPMIELVQASGTSGITEFMKDTAAFQDMLMRLSLCPLSPSNLLSIHRTALRLCMVDTEVIRLDLPESRLVDTLQHMSRLLTTAMKVAVAARQPCRRVWSEESCAKILLGYMEKMLQKDLSEPIRKALADLMASAMTFFNVNLDVIPLAVSSRLGLRPCPYDATYGRRLSQRQRDKEWEYEVEQIALDTKDFRRTELVCMGCAEGHERQVQATSTRSSVRCGRMAFSAAVGAPGCITTAKGALPL